MASANGYSMTLVMQREDTGKVSTLFYRLDDTNNAIDPIVKGWEDSGFIVESISFVRGGR
jgi:hypothetical protein